MTILIIFENTYLFGVEIPDAYRFVLFPNHFSYGTFAHDHFPDNNTILKQNYPGFALTIVFKVVSSAEQKVNPFSKFLTSSFPEDVRI